MPKEKTSTDMQPSQALGTAPDIPYIDDAHWGQGGQFVYDPATGLRTPAQPALQSEKA